MNLKKIAAGVAMVCALGFSAVGVGTATASAAPSVPAATGILFPQDRGHDWDHHDDRHWGERGGWDHWGDGPGWGCVTGPFGHITWCP